ncbi:MAG: RNA pseudouridine synthase, partial [Candidatus Omnitrophica bacterium]|nr:RNA pseudouridine synthase [Candidatus Omnitrophota bacterium]
QAAAGKLAITRYRVLEQLPRFAVLEAEILTGRTNQIRIQFSQAGHPLVGERKYAFARDYSLKFHRSALHSRVLEWKNFANRFEGHAFIHDQIGQLDEIA